jgi:hypothetical protein
VLGFTPSEFKALSAEQQVDRGMPPWHVPAINKVSPNPRLQRTPSASPPSPLSRKPLGGTRIEGSGRR